MRTRTVAATSVIGGIILALALGIAPAAVAATPAPTPPVVAPVASFTAPLKAKTFAYTAPFGPRCILMRGMRNVHAGADFAAADGAPIRAFTSGTVVSAVDGSSGVNGLIMIKHNIAGVTYYSVYMHMWNAHRYVTVGSKVTTGQHIANEGSSGDSTGAHLHFEIREADAVTRIDPVPFLKKFGIDMPKLATRVSATPSPKVCTYNTLQPSVTVYAGPSFTSPVATIRAQNSPVWHTTSVMTNDFIPVRYGATATGWIYRDTAAVYPDARFSVLNLDVDLVSTAALNLRQYPSEYGAIVSVLPQSTRVTRVGGVSGTWTQITSDGRTGWVRSTYLVPVTRAAVAGSTVMVTTSTSTRTTTAKLNLRATASASGKVLTVLPAGKNLGKVLATTSPWLQVKVGGKTGWVHRDYTRVVTTTKATAMPAAKTWTASADANLRIGPSTSLRAQMTVPRGAKVIGLAGSATGWLKVSYQGVTGWVSAGLLR